MPGNYAGKPILTTAGGVLLGLSASVQTKLTVGAAVKQQFISFAADLATVNLAGDYVFTGRALVSAGAVDTVISVFLNGSLFKDLFRYTPPGANIIAGNVVIPNLKAGDTLGLYGFSAAAVNWTGAFEVFML